LYDALFRRVGAGSGAQATGKHIMVGANRKIEVGKRQLIQTVKDIKIHHIPLQIAR